MPQRPGSNHAVELHEGPSSKELRYAPVELIAYHVPASDSRWFASRHSDIRSAPTAGGEFGFRCIALLWVSMGCSNVSTGAVPVVLGSDLGRSGWPAWRRSALTRADLELFAARTASKVRAAASRLCARAACAAPLGPGPISWRCYRRGPNWAATRPKQAGIAGPPGSGIVRLYLPALGLLGYELLIPLHIPQT